jgi:hypothetical protein
MNHDLWDIGEEGKIPNLGTASTAKILKALIKLRGHMLDSICYIGASEGSSPVSYRISLPRGTKESFENLTGYTCVAVETIGG